MADSSQNDSSSKGFFFNRSLLWKIVAVFTLITMLSIIQFFLVYVSITTIDNEIDDTFDTIAVQNDNAFLEISAIDNASLIQRQINNVISLLNTRIREVEGIYLGYLSGTNVVYNTQYPFISTQIPTLSGELFDLIESIDHPQVNKTIGQGLINNLITERDRFLNLVPNIFEIVPNYVGIEVQETFVNFSNIVNFKIANLLQWMYDGTNNTELFETIKAESVPDSSFALNINSSISKIASDTQLYSDLSTSFVQINGLYVDLLPHVDAVIVEVENALFVVDNFDNVEIKSHVDVVVNITSQINDVTQTVITSITNQESLLNTLLSNVESSFLALETFLTGRDGLLEWSDLSSNALSDELDKIRNDARAELDDEITEAEDIVNNEVRSTRIILLIVLLISVVIIIALLIISNFQISKPVKHISYWSEKISQQDLSYSDYKSKRTDEIGILHNNFRLMNKNLKDIIIEVKKSSVLVSDTASELYSNTEEINATTEEVSAIAQSMAKGSTQQAELIATIVEELQITSDTVDNVINQINYNLRIIHELSEQTNILALNTAIEAANAGEFGRGFVVISDSIRKMASQSKKTTEEVTRDSRDVLMQLQSTFSNITGKIENVAAVSQETAASAEEVAASAEELTAVMETISAKTTILNDTSSRSEALVKNFIIDRIDEPLLGDPSKSNGESPAKKV